MEATAAAWRLPDNYKKLWRETTKLRVAEHGHDFRYSGAREYAYTADGNGRDARVCKANIENKGFWKHGHGAGVADRAAFYVPTKMPWLVATPTTTGRRSAARKLKETRRAGDHLMYAFLCLRTRRGVGDARQPELEGRRVREWARCWTEIRDLILKREAYV